MLEERIGSGAFFVVVGAVWVGVGNFFFTAFRSRFGRGSAHNWVIEEEKIEHSLLVKKAGGGNGERRAALPFDLLFRSVKIAG